MRIFFRIILTVFILLILVCTFSYYHVNWSVDELTTSDLSQLPDQKVAVVLGTSARLASGNSNPYFNYRINASVELYNSGKVQYILVSGDNRRENYNEPVKMRKALIAQGIPADKIELDYAGFRTLDSMVRAGKVFGQDSFIVVSQAFHTARAVYIARHFEIEAFGYNARDLDMESGFKTRIREVLARVKMMLDLYVLGTEPKFLGEKVSIGE